MAALKRYYKEIISCVFFLLLFLAVREDLNTWFQEFAGKQLASITTYLDGNRFLLWVIVAGLTVTVSFICWRNMQDFYRSKVKVLLIAAAVFMLWSSYSFWDYICIWGKFNFFHLVVILAAALVASILITPRRGEQEQNQKDTEQSNLKKCFTVDNVRAKVSEADENRRAYANGLVERILNTDISEEALSVGISGEWGSGKSTFLEALKIAFENSKSKRVSTVVEFHPWDGASSGQIVTDFFNVLVGKFENEYSVLKGPMLKYAELLTALDVKKPVIFLAGLLDKKRKKSLSETKKQISKYLVAYHKIVPVLIDDLDRLTADEIADVLKLIRNTADFPNLVYISAYDKNYVCEQLEQRRKIENAAVYLEKFFSVEFVLPKLDDRYQYDVLAEEVKLMHPHKELWSLIENLSGGSKHLLYKHFRNFRQVKRFARIFVHDCDYFLQMPNATRIIELQDLFLLKMLAFMDIDTYLKLEGVSPFLVVTSSKEWSGFKPLQLRPGVLGEAVSKDDEKNAYKGAPLSDVTRDILRLLFAQPRSGRKKTCFINPESAPIYFMLNIPSRTIPVLEVNKLIAGEGDVEKRFKEWKEGEKLQSLYNHLVGINTRKMTEEQAQRYLHLCLDLFPYLTRVKEMGEHALRSYRYSTALYEKLRVFVKERIEQLISKAGADLFEDYNRLMKCFTLFYQEQMEAEGKGEDNVSLLGTTDDMEQFASQTFNAYAKQTGRDADDVLREDSLTRSIMEDAVVSYHDEEGEWQGCHSLIGETIIAFFSQHKGKKKDFAAHYFDIDPDTPVQYEEDESEAKYHELLQVFGSDDIYKRFVEECFQ